MWREDQVKVYPERIKDEELIKAYEVGMVGKYTVDVGWEKLHGVQPIRQVRWLQGRRNHHGGPMPRLQKGWRQEPPLPNNVGW